MGPVDQSIQLGDGGTGIALEINGYKLKVTQLQQALETAQANAKLVQGEQEVPEALKQSQLQVQTLQDTILQLQEKMRAQQEQKEKNAAEVTRLENLLKNQGKAAAPAAPAPEKAPEDPAAELERQLRGK